MGERAFRASRPGLFFVTAVTVAASGAAARADIINGMVARYGFDSAPNVGVDASGNNNNGSLSAFNAAWFNDPTRGGVLSLTPTPGLAGSMIVGDSPSLSITGAITISAMVNINDYANFNGIVGKTASNQPASYDLYTVQGSGLPRLYRGNGAGANGQVSGTTPVPVGGWHHYAVTMSDAGQVLHYLDGTFIGGGSIATTLADTDGPMFVGSRFDGVTAFNGQIDEVRIYNRDLSGPDVLELFAASTAVPEPGMVGALALIGMSSLSVRRRRR
jgi:hypothetical protein